MVPVFNTGDKSESRLLTFQQDLSFSSNDFEKDENELDNASCEAVFFVFRLFLDAQWSQLLCYQRY